MRKLVQGLLGATFAAFWTIRQLWMHVALILCGGHDGMVLWKVARCMTEKSEGHGGGILGMVAADGTRGSVVWLLCLQ